MTKVLRSLVKLMAFKILLDFHFNIQYKNLDQCWKMLLGFIWLK